MKHQTPEEREAAPAWVARDPRCGHNLLVMVDTPERAREVAKEIAACIRAGLVPERVTVAQAREIGLQWCDVCRPPKGRKKKTSPADGPVQESLL